MLARLEENKRIALIAAQIIRERGLCKYIAEDEMGRVCLLGALNAAMFGKVAFNRHNPEYELLYQIASDIGRRVCGPNEVCDPVLTYVQRAVIWNNESTRTADDVINALEDYALAVD